MTALREVKYNSHIGIGINDTKGYEGKYLIRNDPITCMCYYNHRINALCHLISHDYKYIVELEEHLFLTQSQNRGRQHDHGLLWVNNASNYRKNLNTKIEEFVDRYLSYNS